MLGNSIIHTKSMVRLKNISRNGKQVMMDCYEEGNQKRVHYVVFDTESLEIVNGVKNNIYIMQGIAKIWKYLRSGEELPQETVSYWY